MLEVKWQDTEVTNARQFIFGGKSEFTITNIDSGKGAKYKVNRCKTDDKMFFVNVKENESYIYAGFMKVDKDGSVSYIQGRKGNLEPSAEPIKGLMWAIRQPEGPLRKPIVMFHHGSCACCGKSLDDPLSIGRGIGPVCWNRLKARYKGTNII